MIKELTIPGAFVFEPKQLGDDRGAFLEWFKADVFEDVAGHTFDLRQANMSTSAAGALRGIHFADVPPGQAKYVTCPKGAVLDVIVDIRLGSPTFGHWESVVLDDVERKCVYLPEGLGHAFLSLEDGSTVVYLCSSAYDPSREHGIHPLDDEVGIVWPTYARNGRALNYELSEKDSQAPSLSAARENGLLPRFEGVVHYIDSLKGRKS